MAATYSSSQIRNFAIVGHGHSGKTSIAEGLLFNAGATSRLGEAGTPTSTLDFEPEEHARATVTRSTSSTPRATGTSSSTPSRRCAVPTPWASW